MGKNTPAGDTLPQTQILPDNPDPASLDEREQAELEEHLADKADATKPAKGKAAKAVKAPKAAEPEAPEETEPPPALQPKPVPRGHVRCKVVGSAVKVNRRLHHVGAIVDVHPDDAASLPKFLQPLED